jgi:tRNA pseudouridine13 synthase
MRTGGLVGNRFVVRLRNVEQGSCEAISLQASLTIEAGGFINRYGSQRFGKGAVMNPLIGASLLRCEYARAIVLILNRVLDIKAIDSIDPKSILGDIGPALWGDRRDLTSTEESVLEAISKHGANDYGRILDAIPRTLRRLFVESWQSEIWNSLANIRNTVPPIVMVGDQILLDSATQNPFTAWEISTAELGSFHIHSVTAEEVACKRFEPTCVVLPLIGTSVHLPEWAVEAIERHALAPADLLDAARAEHKKREFTLRGSYRHLYVLPRKVAVNVADEAGDITICFELPSAAYATEFLSFVIGQTL